mgnify:CR=1 FL=1
MNAILLQITSKGAEEVAEVAGSSIFDIISGIGLTGLVIMTIIFR